MLSQSLLPLHQNDAEKYFLLTYSACIGCLLLLLLQFIMVRIVGGWLLGVHITILSSFFNASWSYFQISAVSVMQLQLVCSLSKSTAIGFSILKHISYISPQARLDTSAGMRLSILSWFSSQTVNGIVQLVYFINGSKQFAAECHHVSRAGSLLFSELIYCTYLMKNQMTWQAKWKA